MNPRGDGTLSGQLALCPSCQHPLAKDSGYCGACGTRVRSFQAGCPSCDEPFSDSSHFCGRCGRALAGAPGAESGTSATVQLVRLGDNGSALSTHVVALPITTVGRSGADVEFADDLYLSPRHAELRLDGTTLTIQDLGSRNGTWSFIDGSYRLRDHDKILIGSQIFRYRRLGYPGPHPPEADATRRLGSLVPSADIASLTQLRSDGSARDVTHLSPGRNLNIGRDEGDWLFSYDPSMSGLHAQIRSEDADFTIMDAGSRNGVAIAARGVLELQNGSRFMVGDKMFRVAKT